jgi:hypothetical protein
MAAQADAEPAVRTASLAFIQAASNRAVVVFNVTTRSQSDAVELGEALRTAGLEQNIRAELSEAGLASFAESVGVVSVETSVDPRLHMLGFLDPCTASDSCQGCQRVVGPGGGQGLAAGTKCTYADTRGLCTLGNGVCESGFDLVEAATLSPQLLMQIRADGVQESETVVRNVVRAAVWWAHLVDANQVAVVDTAAVQGGVTVSLVLNTITRQRGVELMASVYKAVIDGSFFAHLAAGAAVCVQDCRDRGPPDQCKEVRGAL